MERRSLLKATLGLAAGAALSRGAGERVEAETIPDFVGVEDVKIDPAWESSLPMEHVTMLTPRASRLVGTGCSACRPDLFPAGFGDNRVPMNDNHHSVQWMRIPDPYVPPVITLAGVPVSQVTELHTGPDGWLIRNHLDDAHVNPNGKPYAHLCDCGAPEVQIELWRGPVAQTGITQVTIPEIIAARDERVQRDAQFREIDGFLMLAPDWVETVHAERRDNLGKRPVLRRDALVDMAATRAANDGYLRKVPGDVHLAWEPI